MIWALGGVIDGAEAGCLPVAAVELPGNVPALGASGLLHAAVYGTGGLKSYTVYGGTMETGIKFNRPKNATSFRLMTARFDGRCSMARAAVDPCGRGIKAGEQIVYDSHERVAMHAACCPFLADLGA